MISIPESEWKWFGTAGHFICGQWCRFHLCTQVGNYLVSTVGQYFPPEGVREILAEKRGITLEGRGEYREADYLIKVGFEDIGYKRKYETMVFAAGPTCTVPECECGMPTTNGYEIDFAGANTTKEAMEMHVRLCRKFASEELAGVLQ